MEVFFRQGKDKLAFERYQIRSSKGIKRYWLLMSLAHFLACTGGGKVMPFEEGYAFFHDSIMEERIRYIYQCGVKRVNFTDVLASVA